MCHNSYIVDFTVIHLMEAKADWNDFFFASWVLAYPLKGTNGMNSEVISPDMSNWKF